MCRLQTSTSIRSSWRMTKHLSFPLRNLQVICYVLIIDVTHSTCLFLDATISNVTNGFRSENPNNVNHCESVSDDSYRCERHLDHGNGRTYVDLKGEGTLTSISVFVEGKELHNCVGWFVSCTWIGRWLLWVATCSSQLWSHKPSDLQNEVSCVRMQELISFTWKRKRHLRFIDWSMGSVAEMHLSTSRQTFP